MIYQLKITLKDTKPPVWRRIQVDSKTTFATLHRLIQISFDWMDYHLHAFQVRGPNGTACYIEPVSPEDDDFLFFAEKVEKLDEQEEILEDHLEKEKDKCLYIYDFGDDWQHQIVLEKILEPEIGVHYPRCVKAMRLAPEEDSRGMWLEGDIPGKHVDLKKLVEEINEAFELEQDLTEAEEEAEAKEAIWQRLFDQAVAYKKLKPWQWMSDDQIIAVQLPDSGEMAYCSVLGAMGEEFGLVIYLGDDGLRSMQETMRGTSSIDDIVSVQRSILVSFSDRDELDKEDYELIVWLGRSFRGKKQWPMFRSFKPGYYPWYLDEDEAEIASIVLEQVIDVAVTAKADEELVPDQSHAQWFARIPDATGGQLVWCDSMIKPELRQKHSGPSPLYVSEFEMKKLQKQISGKLDTVIEFGSFHFGDPIQDHPDQRPYFLKVVVGIDLKEGLVIYHSPVGYENFPEAFQTSFLDMIQRLGKRPAEVRVEGMENHNILQPVFKALSIKGTPVDKLELLDEVKRFMMG
ncbi:MAG: plasmid pRiA4b ORF-3 family protein [Bacillaceae bacterium]|nr:plasmid pRiA4b ORF-3 family protein [Bacillaceae bacterium]